MDFEVIKRVLASLERKGVRYAIFGAVALNLHGLARLTEALDIFLDPEQKNIERLRAALHAVFDDPEIDNITAEDLLGDYPAVQYVPPDGSFQIDILTWQVGPRHFEYRNSGRAIPAYPSGVFTYSGPYFTSCRVR